MKIKNIIIGIILFISCFIFSSCSKNENVVINTKENQTTIVLFESELDSFSFNNIFVIKVNDKNVEVKDDYIDTSKITGVGKFIVSCNYKDVVKNIQVTIKEDIYSVNTTVEYIDLFSSQVDSYDFNSLFNVTKNGNKIDISDDMITNQVSSVPGVYYYTVSVKNYSDSLVVRVKEDYDYSQLVVGSKNESVTVIDEEISSLELTSLFIIKYKNKNVEVKNEYISGSVGSVPGTYPITLTYNTKTTTCNVIVRKALYALETSNESIELNYNQVSTYVFSSLFTLTREGVKIDIPNDCISSNVKSEVGTYTYTVSYKGLTKSISVNVVEVHNVEIIKNYSSYSIALSNLSSFNYKSLFSVYVDSEIIDYDISSINLSNLNNAIANQTYTISISYTAFKITSTSSIEINVTCDDELVINTKNIDLFINSNHIELTSLFSVKLGDKELTIDPNNISGEINYNLVGSYDITLSYNSNEYISHVNIISGASIDYKKDDTVYIVLGTNQNTYDFVNDFVVNINGSVLCDIPLKYFDFGTLDFNTKGSYEVTLSIPFATEVKTGLSTKVTFTNITKTITYIVSSYNGSASVKEDTIYVDSNTYNVFDNIKCFMNNRKMIISDNISWANYASTVYGEIINGFDNTKAGNQTIIVDIYANGLDASPIRLTYTLIRKTNIKIDCEDKIIFTGNTLYTKDLFRVYDTNTNQEISITNDYIEGFVNVFEVGKYEVSINYLGNSATCVVTVLDNSIVGTYYTNIKTVGASSYYYDEDELEEETTVVRSYGNMIIDEKFNIKIDGNDVTNIKCIDANTFNLKLKGYEYVVTFDNGIVTLNPDNSLKLGFSDNSKRPLVYFNKALYNIDQKFVINSGSSYILATEYTGTSYDVFKLTNKLTSETFYYAMYVNCYFRGNGNTQYQVNFGKVSFASNLDLSADANNTMLFNNNSIIFNGVDGTWGKIQNSTVLETYIYANKTFSGTIDGKTSYIAFDSYGGYNLRIDNKLICTVTTYDLNNNKMLGLDDNGNLIIYDYEIKESDGKYFYAFKLNTNDNTFIQVALDGLEGRYESNNFRMFINGQGNGFFQFSKSSYYQRMFSYYAIDNKVYLEFDGVDNIDSNYGSSLVLTKDIFNNKFSIIECMNKNAIDVSLNKTIIFDGAIVDVNINRIGMKSKAVCQETLLNNITIITKDGILTNEQKLAMIDFSKLAFTKPGFYEYSITIPYQDSTFKLYYGLQMLESTYSSSKLVGGYSNSVLNDGTSILIDEYGLITYSTNNGTYSGIVNIINNKAYGTIRNNSKYATITLELIEEGILHVSSYGDLNIEDYYTSGSIASYGITNYCLRVLKGKDEELYLYSSNTNALGKIYELELLEGSKVISGSVVRINNLIFKLNDLNSSTTGLIVGDNYYGTYANTTYGDIKINAFGVLTTNSINYDYKISNGSVVVVRGNQVYQYVIDKVTTTYTLNIIEASVDSLVNKSLSASYLFTCNSEYYTANTTLMFKANGIIEIVSSSKEHDSGDDKCETDYYNPLFTGTGTYGLSNGLLRVIINEYQIVFSVNDILNISSLTFVSTTVPSTSHGVLTSSSTIFK